MAFFKREPEVIAAQIDAVVEEPSASVGDTQPSDSRELLIVGCGKMGEAILSGLLSATEGPAAGINAGNVSAIEPSKDRANQIYQKYGVNVFLDLNDVIKPDVVLLAVKPQVLYDVMVEVSELPSLQSGDSNKNALIISIAAGIPTSEIESACIDPVRVIRAMPNMPLQIGVGATALCKGANATDADLRYVKGLFDAIGITEAVDESQIDAVCAISGGGPAYFAKMVELMTESGIAAGLPGNVAQALSVQTMLGTAAMLAKGDFIPAELREAVCSPGGTTLAALAAMDEAGFSKAIPAGIDAAIERAKEL